MLKTDSVVRCIRTVYRCLLCATSTAREWVLHLAPGGICFVRYNNTCIKQSPRIMSTPGDHTQEPNMEGQETVAPITVEPCLEDKKVEDDPVVEPVVSGLSAIGLELATAVNPDVLPEVAQPRQAIPTQEINPKFLTWTTAKALILEYPTLEEYKKANERLIRDLENHDNEDYPKF
jgi:hypothetical protein